jgi:hypothetical protein
LDTFHLADMVEANWLGSNEETRDLWADPLQC